MITFKDLNTLKKFFEKDKAIKSFSPVRFVNVDTISAWNEVKSFLISLTGKTIFLSNFCEDADTAPNLRRLYSTLKKETKSACILPLSEFLRLQPERTVGEIQKLLNIQTTGSEDFRLYFLMYRMKNIFLPFKTTDPRKNNCVISLESEKDYEYSLTVVQKSINLDILGNRADGFKQYFEYWEDTPGKQLIFYTNNAMYLQGQHFYDNVVVIADGFNSLRHRYNLPKILEKKFGSEEQWNNLAGLISKVGNFHKALCKEFSTDSFRISLFRYWDGANKFRRWLLWLWCKTQDTTSYAVKCAVKSSSPENFVTLIYTAIFDYVSDKNFAQIYDERKEILLSMKVSVPENFVEQIKQSDKKIALQVLTDNSALEKNLIFDNLQKCRFSEYGRLFKVLKKIYPDLANYLFNEREIISDKLSNYFRQYRWLKVTNSLTENFYGNVQEIARQRGQDVYALKSRDQIVAEEYSDKAAIYFVDGMGAEYLDVLVKLFSTLDVERFSVNYQVGYCELPSITEVNKDFLQGRNIVAKTLELDEMKHSDLSYPENIINELNFFTALKEKIMASLGKYKKIILCSDHGTSRLAVLARKTKFNKSFANDGRNIYNCGRYADALTDDANKFDSAILYKGKIHFADYARFLQQGAPGNEIHGGASLEEWLVPVVTIEQIEKKSANQKVKSVTRKVKRGLTKNETFDI